MLQDHSKANREDELRPQYTLIKLEVLQKAGVSAMLFLIVATFIVCVVLASLDTKVRLNEKTLAGVPCSKDVTDNCFVKGPTGLVYTFEVTNLSELSKNIYGIGRVKLLRDQDVDQEVPYQVQVYGRDSTSDAWREKLTEDYTIKLSCKKKGDYCLDHVLFLYSPIEDKNVRFNITLNKGFLGIGGETEYLVYWQKESFTIMVFVLMTMFFICACSFLFAYVRSVKIDHDNPHPEQRWIAFLVGACIFMNRINEIPSIITGEDSLAILSLSSNILSSVIFLVVFMIILEELKRPGLEYTFRFFIYKITYGAITFSVALSAQIIKRNDLPAGLSFTDFLKNDQTIPRDEAAFEAYVGLTIVLGIIYVAWSLWFIKRIRELNRSLKGAGFILTRFRQLSFRLFLILGFFFSIYFVTLLIASYSDFDYGIAEDRPLSSLILYSVYILTLGYVYLPADSRDIITLGLNFGFSLYGRKSEIKLIGPDPQDDCFKENRFYVQTAKNLSWIALKVYFEPGAEDGEFIRKESATIEEKIQCRQRDYEYKEKIFDEETDTHAYIFVSGSRIVVAFRGTNSVANAKTDADVFRCDWVPSLNGSRNRRNFSGLRIPHGIVETVRPMAVHRGFFTSYCKIRERMVKRVFETTREVRKRTNEPLTILVTGHSLGGALATFAALDIAEMCISNTKVVMYNFGSPRVGNHSFADYYNTAVPNSFRITGDQDIVTSLPKFIFFFKHIGNEVTVDPDGNVLLKMTSFERFLQTKNSLNNHRICCYFNAMSLCLENVSHKFATEKGFETNVEFSAKDLITCILPISMESTQAQQTEEYLAEAGVFRLSDTTDEDQQEREEELQSSRVNEIRLFSTPQPMIPTFGHPPAFAVNMSASSPNVLGNSFRPNREPLLLKSFSGALQRPASKTGRSRYRTEILSQVIRGQDPLLAYKYEDEQGLLKALGAAPTDVPGPTTESDSEKESDFLKTITDFFK